MQRRLSKLSEAKQRPGVRPEQLLQQVRAVASSDVEAAWGALQAADPAEFWLVAMRATALAQAGAGGDLGWLCERSHHRATAAVGAAWRVVEKALAGELAWDRYIQDLQHHLALAVKGADAKERRRRQAEWAGALLFLLASMRDHPRWPMALLGLARAAAGKGTSADKGKATGREATGSVDAPLASALELWTNPAPTRARQLWPLLQMAVDEAARAQASAQKAGDQAAALQDALGRAVEANRALQVEVSSLRERVAHLEAALAEHQQRAAELEERNGVLERLGALQVAQAREAVVAQVRKYVGQDVREIAIALERHTWDEAREFIAARLESLRRFLADLGGRSDGEGHRD